MKQFFAIVLLTGLVFVSRLTVAQNTPVINATVTGKVIDARTGKNLIDATVTIKGTPNGATTNQNSQFLN